MDGGAVHIVYISQNFRLRAAYFSSKMEDGVTSDRVLRSRVVKLNTEVKEIIVKIYVLDQNMAQQAADEKGNTYQINDEGRELAAYMIRTDETMKKYAEYIQKELTKYYGDLH